MEIGTINDTIAAIATPLGTGGVGVIRVSGEKSFEIISKIFTSHPDKISMPTLKPHQIYHGWAARLHHLASNPSMGYVDHNIDTESLDTGLDATNVKPYSQALSGMKGCHSELSGCFEDLNLYGLDETLINDFELVDEVLLLVFKAPNSYTGEDVIEIQCHGGVNIVKKILNLCLESGARLADKGEFTKRAFLNGKLDLSRAEAVLDLIHSKTDKFSSISAHNLSGKLSACINGIRGELVELLSRINAAIDFPDEVDEPEYSFIEGKIDDLTQRIDKILGTAKSSNLMRQGMKVAIAGKPNVGKSSMFNALLNIERAIVTEIPGTTRDIIQESIDINGIPVTLIDTAGIRELENNHSSDYIESIGINISKSYIHEADVVLFMFDLTQGLQAEDSAIFEEIKEKPVIKIGSKADAVEKQEENLPKFIPVSSKTGEGLELIKKEIEKLIFSDELSGDCEFSTNIRQQECLNKAKTSLLQAKVSCNSREAQDFIAIDLKSALISLGEITGEVISDEIIENIFSSFCIGK